DLLIPVGACYRHQMSALGPELGTYVCTPSLIEDHDASAKASRGIRIVLEDAREVGAHFHAVDGDREQLIGQLQNDRVQIQVDRSSTPADLGIQEKQLCAPACQTSVLDADEGCVLQSVTLWMYGLVRQASESEVVVMTREHIP